MSADILDRPGMQVLAFSTAFNSKHLARERTGSCWERPCTGMKTMIDFLSLSTAFAAICLGLEHEPLKHVILSFSDASDAFQGG
ncbi:MAG: hypothetical protein CMD92_01365 [Gammaproteobacteria bacterium]|nr:hypothetical protein [Gammaproteobacteria bacterium]HBW83301.1 hypothetical protein [Gammaproteobacteria bacterium]